MYQQRSSDVSILPLEFPIRAIGNGDVDTIKEGERAPMAAVTELADSSVNMLLRVWAPTDDYWTVKFRLTEAVKLALDDAGIEIPFNQLDVHLINS